MYETRDFWYQTAAAHMTAALLQLCRVYDYSTEGINLYAVLSKIRENCSKEVAQRQLRTQVAKDIQICGRAPACEASDRDVFADLVKKLRRWRNEVIAHYNYRVAIFDAQEFRSRNRWELNEIQELIDQAVVILVRYSFAERKDVGYAECFEGKADYSIARQVVDRFATVSDFSIVRA